MTLNLTLPVANHTDFSPRIAVIGVGGGGTNAVNNMIAMGLEGVEFIVANTDAQSLLHSRADRRVQLGPHLTQGLGAGAKPEIGRAAAEEATDELAKHIEGCHMVFVTAGMGGGTGTGAAPVIARMARERNMLTVGVVTKPFDFEGAKRKRAADVGIEELQQFVDTLIVIPNQNLFRLANERTTFAEAFKMADNVLYMGVKGVTDLMVNPGMVNLDFADIRTVMAEMGKAMMGTGEAEGDDRAVKAAEAAISNPLLEDTSMRGAKGVLISLTGGYDLTLFEVDEAVNRIRKEVDDEANIIFGSSLDENLNGRVRVSVVATGIDAVPMQAAQPAEAAPTTTPGPRLAVVQPGVARTVQQAAALRRPNVLATPPGALRTAATTSQMAQPAPSQGSLAIQASAAQAQPAYAPQPEMAPEPMPQPVPVMPPAAMREAPAMRPAAMPAAPVPEPQQAAGFRRIFHNVTGLMKRQVPVQPEHPAQPQRAEPQAMPSLRAEAPRAPQDDTEIPAFLRRQNNY
ncbi:cell division protein FtsZ [Rhodovarius crocodyli]|uniref:Cell division protein FtsZ n=1 Tax=Rhodovarius crocodyli TaxID=1979269 RepID=A0A437MIJ1_9PROT|nr:cell division protein FtsZ [Rhodovarius crocodyli]RVT97452.1 cell division protein FtsZ [Rhodovarius crocodyli]